MKMVSLFFALCLCVFEPYCSTAADYTLAEPVRIGVEAQQYALSIDATGYSVEQLSILRLPGGNIQCRATLQVSDGSNTYRRVITADQAELIEAIGPQALQALIYNMGATVGEILKKKATQF